MFKTPFQMTLKCDFLLFHNAVMNNTKYLHFRVFLYWKKYSFSNERSCFYIGLLFFLKTLPLKTTIFLWMEWT